MNNQTHDRECQDAQRQLEAFLDGSLPTEVGRVLAAHLARCSHCDGELETLRSLSAQVKLAVQRLETPAYLETRIGAHLREARKRSHWFLSLAAVAAGVSVLAFTTFAYERGYLRSTRNSQEAYVSSVSSRVTGFISVGLGDHIHCAVFRKYPATSPTMAEFVAKIGLEYSGIIPIVRDHVPTDFQLMLAHRCTYRSRQFVHMVLRSDAALLSVVITRKRDSEALLPEELAPELSAPGISIYHSSAQRFQIAAFESRDHMVYLISDLPAQHNTELMQAMAPALHTFLSKLES